MRIYGFAIIALSVVCLQPRALQAQTFVQLPDLGSGIGPRLTRQVALTQINRQLFGRIGTKVTFIESGLAYEFATDPDWSRLVFGRKDQWIHAYTNSGGPGGKLADPMGVDVSARRYVYVADRSQGRVLGLTFDPVTKALISPRSASVTRPVDVAWDGTTTPLTQDFVYVLDDSLASVRYWDWNSGGTPTALWSYGSPGSGTGQFSWPTGVCVGKTVAGNGSTQFTTSFYIVDRGNARVVWLSRTPTGATWNSTITMPNWDPTDCAVDHFGQVYVVDEQNHRIHKFNQVLWHIASYGSYGKGANNLNTFAFPHAISVPCGLKSQGGQTVWYCEGRLITGEQWSDSTGAVEHYMGIESSFTQPVSTPPSTGSASTAYTTTEVAYATVTVFQVGTGTIKTLMSNYLLGGGGSWGVFWNGTKTDGTRAPDGQYQFRVSLASAYTGCGSNPWCFSLISTSNFYFDNCIPGGPLLRAGSARGAKPQPTFPMPSAEMEPCSGGNLVAGSGPTGEPRTPFFSQQVAVFAKPLMRVEIAGAADLRADDASAGTSLSDLVRQYGVRGLRFGLTREMSGQRVTIRVQSMSGRLVRTLVSEELMAGSYEIGWDGLDDQGRRVAPGVYIATLAAGLFRGTQRLILRQSN